MRENELIKLEDLAKAYETLLGSEFAVYVDSMVNVDEDKIPIVMYATRMPYKIPNIDTETLQMGFSAYISCENKEAYAEKITRISRLLGYNKGTLTSNGNTYTYYSFLDFSRPLTDPVVDSGEFMQSLVLSGTCLISGAQGALVGNDVKTEIYINDPEGEETLVGGEVAVLSSTTSLQKVAESIQKVNTNKSRPYCSIQSIGITMSCLFLKTSIDNIILEQLNMKNNERANRFYWVKKIYPSFTIIKKCKLLQGSINETAGAFVQYNITLQEV